MECPPIRRQEEVRGLLTGVLAFKTYCALGTNDGTVVTVPVCDDQAVTQESTPCAADWVRQNLFGPPISPPEITEGETIRNF